MSILLNQNAPWKKLFQTIVAGKSFQQNLIHTVPKTMISKLVLRDRIGDPIMIGRFLDFFTIISDARFLSVRGDFLCVCTIHDKYK